MVAPGKDDESCEGACQSNGDHPPNPARSAQTPSRQQEAPSQQRFSRRRKRDCDLVQIEAAEAMVLALLIHMMFSVHRR
jgi:hypothetical protein